MNIGKNIEKMMKQRGVSCKELSDFLGVHFTTPYTWISGKSKPTYENLSAIASFLHCGVDELLSGFPPRKEIPDVGLFSEYSLDDECPFDIVVCGDKKFYYHQDLDQKPHTFRQIIDGSGMNKNERIFIIAENPTHGYVFSFGNYGDSEKVYLVGTTVGYA